MKRLLVVMSIVLAACASNSQQTTPSASEEAVSQVNMTAPSSAAESSANAVVEPEPEPDPEPYESLPLYTPEQTEGRAFDVIESLSAVDCADYDAAEERWGVSLSAARGLQKRAWDLDADALVNVVCGASPMKRGCWRTEKCTGDAVRLK